jgi:hypothetical protein
MTSVGEILRTQRKTQGREVDEIAAHLCIVSGYVRSIERDDLKDLPGVFFYKSFVKQYAAAVGLDYTQLQSGVEALTALEEPPALPYPASQPAAWWQPAVSKLTQLRILLLRPGKIGEWAADRKL